MYVILRLYTLHTSLSLSLADTDKVDKHLQYLLELVPQWIKSVKVSKGVFVKTDKKADLKTVMAKLERTRHNLDNPN